MNAQVFWGRTGLIVGVGLVLISYLVSFVSIAAIVYLALTEQWIAAIFALLARREMVRWMRRTGKRLGCP